MLVHALISTVRAHPSLAVLAFLNGFEKELAGFVESSLGITIPAEVSLGENG